MERQQPLYIDLEKVLGSQQLSDEVLNVLQRYYGCMIDKDKLIKGLQSDSDYNPSMNWIGNEIQKANALIASNRNLLNPDDAEIIVSPKDKVVSQKTIDDKLMRTLFINWTNTVLCSRSFNGKVNAIKEPLSDEITTSARDLIGAEWDNSPIRTYLNQLRRHVRGEEFNQPWDNGVLSSMAAVLLKGDDWEKLLHFMQSKGMYDYRLAFAIYGVLNGFANLTRDFTDLLLNQESNYLAAVYREFYGQLHEKSTPKATTDTFTKINEPQDRPVQVETVKQIEQWRKKIVDYATTIIKRNKDKLLNSLNDALIQNGDNQDYFKFITMLDNFEGWKPGKKGPCSAWERMQERFVPDYNQRIGNTQKQKQTGQTMLRQEKTLFDESDSTQSVAQSLQKPESRRDKSILDDYSKWIDECESFVNAPKAKEQFINDMKWLADIYLKIPIDEIMKYLSIHYGD